MVDNSRKCDSLGVFLNLEFPFSVAADKVVKLLFLLNQNAEMTYIS